MFHLRSSFSDQRKTVIIKMKIPQTYFSKLYVVLLFLFCEGAGGFDRRPICTYSNIKIALFALSNRNVNL